jgi:hypothetical protein
MQHMLVDKLHVHLVIIAIPTLIASLIKVSFKYYNWIGLERVVVANLNY